jgi:hypothetical protein
MGLTAVESKASWGIYVWQMDNGQPFTDGNGGVMNIPGKKYDLEKMSLIAQAARHYGAPSGEAKFLAGVQRSSEMRHSEEIDRMKEGYIPSETDIGAWADAQQAYSAARAAGVDYDRD